MNKLYICCNYRLVDDRNQNHCKVIKMENQLESFISILLICSEKFIGNIVNAKTFPKLKSLSHNSLRANVAFHSECKMCKKRFYRSNLFLEHSSHLQHHHASISSTVCSAHIQEAIKAILIGTLM